MNNINLYKLFIFIVGTLIGFFGDKIVGFLKIESLKSKGILIRFIGWIIAMIGFILIFI